MKNVSLSSGITVNNLLANKILQTEEFDQKICTCICNREIGGALNLMKLCHKTEITMKFNKELPKAKLPWLKNTAKSTTVRKNKEVNRDILSCLVCLLESSGLAVNYEKDMEY